MIGNLNSLWADIYLKIRIEALIPTVGLSTFLKRGTRSHSRSGSVSRIWA